MALQILTRLCLKWSKAKQTNKYKQTKKTQWKMTCRPGWYVKVHNATVFTISDSSTRYVLEQSCGESWEKVKSEKYDIA